MRLRPIALTLCALSACAALATPAAAAKRSCEGLPAHGSFPVVDAANVVDTEQEAWLIADLMRYHLTGHEAIVAATVSDLGGDDVSSYATRLFDCWGIGDEKADNGILILVAMRERRVRIELGAGLDGRLTDGQLEAAIATMTAPLRRQDVATALRSAAATLVRDLGGELPDTKAGGVGSVPSMITPGDDVVDTPPGVSLPGGFPDGIGPFGSDDPGNSGLGALIVIAIVVGVVVMVVRAVAGVGHAFGGSVWRGGFPGYGGSGTPWGPPAMLHRGSWRDASSMRGFGSPGSAGSSDSGSSGSSDSGSSSSSGGSGSFGGGSSGGGGASGSW